MENIDIYNKKVDELSNANSLKREYVKSIELLKKSEPEADGVDYYETRTNVDGEEYPFLVEVPKPHKEWEEKLANHEAGLLVTKNDITALRDEIDTLEATLIG